MEYKCYFAFFLNRYDYVEAIKAPRPHTSPPRTAASASTNGGSGNGNGGNKKLKLRLRLNSGGGGGGGGGGCGGSGGNGTRVSRVPMNCSYAVYNLPHVYG